MICFSTGNFCTELSFPLDFEGGQSIVPLAIFFFGGTISISVRDWRNGVAWLKP